MKVDLLTLLPSVVLQTQRWGRPDGERDSDLCTEFAIGKSFVISYQAFLSKTKVLDKKQQQYISEISPKCIDAAGSPLKDFAIILDRNVDGSMLEPPNTDATTLLTYLGYTGNLDRWVPIDTIKIRCYKGAGREILVNNTQEHWRPKHVYMLPIEQDHKPQVRISKKHELVLIEALTALSKHDKTFYERLLNAIALFNESARLERLSPNASIALIVSAHEALLQLPRRSKTESFGYAFKILWGFSQRIEDWAKELYSLRSQIVHGDVVDKEKLLASKDRHYPHLSIAREIFEHNLNLILDRCGIIKYADGYWDGIFREMHNKTISNKEKVQRILNRRKALTYKSFVGDQGKYRSLLVNLEGLTSLDYSAADKIWDLLTLIKTITVDWFAVRNKELEQYKTKAPMKSYVEWQQKSQNEILNSFLEIEKLPHSLNGRMQLHDKLGTLQRAVLSLNPITHDKETFKFTVDEFLDRSLRALFAVY